VTTSVEPVVLKLYVRELLPDARAGADSVSELLLAFAETVVPVVMMPAPATVIPTKTFAYRVGSSLVTLVLPNVVFERKVLTLTGFVVRSLQTRTDESLSVFVFSHTSTVVVPGRSWSVESFIPSPLASIYMYCAPATPAKPAIATTMNTVVRSRLSMV
jgi:hypothetical protein